MLGVKSGHILGTVNLPFLDFFNKNPNVMKPVDELKNIFLSAGLDLNKPTVISCGTGQFWLYTNSPLSPHPLVNNIKQSVHHFPTNGAVVDPAEAKLVDPPIILSF